MASLLRNRSRRATFLCYHSIADAGMPYLTVGSDRFEAQLDRLEARGIATGGLADLEDAVAGHLRRPTAFLTFDDGFRDNHATVLPILRERGHRAFVFVIPPLVDDGAPLAWPEVADAQREHPDELVSVTWPMVEEMAEGGFEIGSHTLTHPHLPDLDPERLRDELLDSRRRIEERLGSCPTIAYPFGAYDAEVLRASADCGYTYGFTLPTATGQTDATALSIPRLNVDYRDVGRRFDLKLGRPGKSVLLSPQVRRLRGRGRAVLARRGPQTNQGLGPESE